MLDLLYFQLQNLGSGKAYEVENLHLDSQKPQLCVSRISSKPNDFQGGRASEEIVVRLKSPHNPFT